jgi:ABC-type sugar transport system substrate-binding protein
MAGAVDPAGAVAALVVAMALSTEYRSAESAGAAAPKKFDPATFGAENYEAKVVPIIQKSAVELPVLQQVAKESANWDQQEAFTKMETIIQKSRDIQGVIAGNDTMALGAVAALKAAGLLGKVTVVGFDGSPDAIAAVKAGQMHATALQPAALGAQSAVEQADQYIKTGKASKEEKQSVDCELVTAENADDFGVFARK